MHIELELTTARVRESSWIRPGYEVVVDVTLINSDSRVAFGVLTLPFEHKNAAEMRAKLMRSEGFNKKKEVV